MGSHRQLLIAGPCAAESAAQLRTTAAEIAARNIPLHYFRAGIWKPRTHPDDFLGMGSDAFTTLQEIKETYHFPICVEVANAQHVELCLKHHIDAVWIGARTTVNPFMVQEVANALRGTQVGVMVKNPIAPDIKLWFGAIDRIQRVGIENIYAIHRGFAHCDRIIYRNNPLWENPIALKTAYPNIPVICDASHIAGNSNLVEEVAQKALLYGLEGWMIEVHHNPEAALCDAKQQITPEKLEVLYRNLTERTPLSESSKQLEIYREKIGAVDRQMAQLLYDRMQLVDKIAELKQKNNLPIVQHNQWRKVLDLYHTVGENEPHYQKFIALFLEILHQQSIERQEGKLYTVLTDSDQDFIS